MTHRDTRKQLEKYMFASSVNEKKLAKEALQKGGSWLFKKCTSARV